MIVKMKKVSIIVKSSSREEVLSTLSKMGIVHLQPCGPVENGKIEKIKEKISLVKKSFTLVPESFIGKGTSEVDREDGIALAKKILDHDKEITNLKEAVKRFEEEKGRVEGWGEFDPHEISSLKQRGVSIRFFQCQKKKLKNIPDDLAFHIISRKGKTLFLVFFSCRDTARIPFHEVEIPSRSLTEIEGLLKEKRERYFSTKQGLNKLFSKVAALKATEEQLEDMLNYEKAREGMGRDGDISYLTGFCPVFEMESLLTMAGKEQWAILIEDPSHDDPVPTLMKHAAWAKTFCPVMNFIGLTPGYWDYDVNPLFVIFFSIFFALLIGDGGYGLVMLVATYGLKKFYDGISKEMTLLFYFLSFATILWGAVTGQWFGLKTISELPFFSEMIIPSLYSYARASEENVINICFVIGAIQLSLAHLFAAKRLYPALSAFAETGWAAIIWGIYFLAGLLVLNKEMNALGVLLLLVGVIMVISFEEQGEDGIVKGFLHGLVKLPLNALVGIGSFSDLISYLRLFAVGLATKEVAVAFNGMARDFGSDGSLSLLGAILILIFGHSINLLLGAMAVFVHGVRLNILECSRHLNIQWAGITYQPFKIATPEKLRSIDFR